MREWDKGITSSNGSTLSKAKSNSICLLKVCNYGRQNSKVRLHKFVFLRRKSVPHFFTIQAARYFGCFL